MSIIANNLPKFENDIQAYDTVCGKLKTDYAGLIKHMVDLNGMWTGEAYETLMSSFLEDKKEAEGVMEFLEDMSKKLKTADVEYTDCEKQVKQIIDSISI